MRSAESARWRWRVAAGTAAIVASCSLGAAPGASASPTRVSVVVLDRAHAPGHPARAVRRLGGRVGRRLPLINGFTARIPADAVEALRRQPGVRSVTLDRRLKVRSTDTTGVDPAVPLDVAASSIGASTLPSDGTGVDVALVDTGVADVPDLAGRVIDGPDFSSDAADPAKRHLDAFGHGTHMAGIIAGRDVADGFSGIAPGSRVVNVRVADHNGDTSLTQLLAGIDWVGRNAHRDGLNIRVMNLSLGAPVTDSYRDDPLAFAVEQAWRRGIAVVVAAGNSGNDTTSLDSPAYDPYPIAVGAEDTTDTPDPGDDHVAGFSSGGSANRMPDVVAPGVGIISLRVPGGLLDQQFPDARIGSDYFRGSGTSQAAAVVSGAVARLAAARPDLGPDALKALLRASAQPLPGFGALLQGAGLPDVAAALTLPVPADAAQRWQPAKGGGPWRGLANAGVQLAVENNPDGWRVNAWRVNAWRVNAWRVNAWRVNAWRVNAWRVNAWRTTRWTGSSWEAPPTP